MMKLEEEFRRHRKIQHSCKLDSFVYFFFYCVTYVPILPDDSIAHHRVK